jgi:hypothetical protein
MLTTHVNCKTALEERFLVFQGKIGIVFHIYFLKAQGLLRSKRPNLQESPVKKRSLTRDWEWEGGGGSYTIKFPHNAYGAQTSLKAHALHKGGL